MAKGTIKINKKGDDGYKVISVRIKEGTLKKSMSCPIKATVQETSL